MEWYENEQNRNSLKALLKEVKIEKVHPKLSGEGKCAGLTFVMTGDFHHYKNRDAFKAYVESQGGKVTGSVTSKTDYLVNNDLASNSSKNRKAKELGIPIISEDAFAAQFAYNARVMKGNEKYANKSTQRSSGKRDIGK